MSHRYGVRQVLHENGFEVPYELVPDGIRAFVHDVYPCPGIDHCWTAAGLFLGWKGVHKIYRTLNARAIYYQRHPNRKIAWRMPFIHGGKSKFL